PAAISSLASPYPSPRFSWSPFVVLQSVWCCHTARCLTPREPPFAPPRPAAGCQTPLAAATGIVPGRSRRGLRQQRLPRPHAREAHRAPVDLHAVAALRDHREPGMLQVAGLGEVRAE